MPVITTSCGRETHTKVAVWCWTGRVAWSGCGGGNRGTCGWQWGWILMLNSKGILVEGGLVRVWGWEQGHLWVAVGMDTDAGYPCQGWPVVLWWLLNCVILMLNCLKSGYSAVWYWCWTVSSLAIYSSVWYWCWTVLSLSIYSSVWYWCCTVVLWLTGWPGQGGGGGLSQVCSAVWPAGTSPWHLLLQWCRTGPQAGFGKWIVSEFLQLITHSLSLQRKCAVVLLGASGRPVVTWVMQAKLYWNFI